MKLLSQRTFNRIDYISCCNRLVYAAYDNEGIHERKLSEKNCTETKRERRELALQWPRGWGRRISQ